MEEVVLGFLAGEEVISFSAGGLVVFAQQGEHGFAEEDIAVSIPLSSADMNEHALAVNIGGFEGADFGDSQTGSIGNGQDGFVLWRFDRGKDGENFLHGEDFGKGFGYFGVREVFNDLRVAQGNPV
jgi:hypothetical protein